MSILDSSSLYEVLGVGVQASAEEIQRAYRRLARRCHPDVNADPAAAERFQRVVEAYQVLSDPERRRLYDAQRGAVRGGGGSGAGVTRRAGRGPSRASWTWRPPMEDPRSRVAGFKPTGLRADPDLGAFGGHARRADDVEVPLTVEDAYRGARRSVTVCALTGRRTFQVDIPPGMADGQRLKLAGVAGSGTAPFPGDLYLVVHLAPHPIYRVRRRDVTVDLPLTPWEATLGATVAVQTPAGRTSLRVPPGTSSGQTLRVQGLGLPDPRGGSGDLLAVVGIVVPESLGAEERRLVEHLAVASSFRPRAGARV